jgi:hypothetical protein
MPSNLLPYRQVNYRTLLTPEQIGHRLAENVITGFSLYSEKPFYGRFTAYDFSVRKTSSKIKVQSMAPGVDGIYKAGNGETFVTLTVMPHPITFGAMVVFCFPPAAYILFNISEFFKTWDGAILANFLVSVLFLYGIFWVVFNSQSQSALRFWEYTLQLTEVPSVNSNPPLLPQKPPAIE